MSCNKSNGVKLTKCDSQTWKTASIIDGTVPAGPPSVKLAGEEAKDRLYEPKHKKKIVRVLTVVAYVFFVSLAAIMLSLYYVFLWNGEQRVAAKLLQQQNTQQIVSNGGVKCENLLQEIQRQLKLLAATQRPQSFRNDDLEEYGNVARLRGGRFLRKLLE